MDGQPNLNVNVNSIYSHYIRAQRNSIELNVIRRAARNGLYLIPVSGTPRLRFSVTVVDGVCTFVPARVEASLEGG